MKGCLRLGKVAHGALGIKKYECACVIEQATSRAFGGSFMGEKPTPKAHKLHGLMSLPTSTSAAGALAREAQSATHAPNL